MNRSSAPFLLGALLLVGACSSSDASDAASDNPTEAGDRATAPTETVAPASDDELGVSVDGEELTVAEFDEHLESWARLAEAEGQVVREDGVLIPDFIGSITEQYIRFEAFMSGLEADGVEITDEHRDSAEAEALDTLGDPNDEPARALAVQWLSGLAALEPTDTELADYVAANAETLGGDAICSSHILVATIEEAADLVARIGAGEDFATLAMELSIDPGSGAAGGDLGCVGPGAFVPEFEQAALAAEYGVMTEPVQSEFGFHMIVTREPTPDDLEPIAAQVLEEEIRVRLTEAVATATVELAPQFGTWDQATAAYLPPGA